jgi:tRNA A37 methylthiotransferase MiaB
VRDFLEEYGRLHAVFGLGLDLLVGFPGESEEHFEETRTFCASLPMSYAHVFPYSKRPGTVAAKIPGQIQTADKKRRAALLREVAALKKSDFLQRLSGLERLAVALETSGRGHCAQYAECAFERENAAPLGALVAVRPLRVADGELWVELLADQSGEGA